MTNDARKAQFAVRSRKVVFIAGLALIAGAVWALTSGNTPLGVVLFVIAGIAVFARGMWTMRRGLKAVSEYEKAQPPEAAGGTPANPASVERVVADLVGMNSDGLPYVIAASQTATGTSVEVRWKVEEVRWRTLFVKGKQTYAWRMEVDLDPARARYKFTEYSGSASTRSALSPGGAFAHADWKWTRGKTAGKRSATFVEGSDGQVTVRGGLGARTSWEGAVKVQPADAKIPVFTVLRNNGWRPRFDWFGARLFEK
jgi:membrane protein implicated in regulation of membrane protease activity